MFTTSVEITIDRPINDVFDFIADNENDPKWCVPVVETTRITGSAPGAGARYSFASQAGLIKLRGEFEITAFESPGKIEWVGESSIVKFSGLYHLESVGAGTKLKERTTFELKGLLALLQGMMISQYQKTYETQLERLKALLENSEI